MQKFLDRIWSLAGSVSVRTKIFGIVLANTLLISLGFTWLIRTAMYNLLEQKSFEQGIAIAGDISSRSIDLILINDLFSLHELLSETKTNYEDLRYAFVIDTQGNTLAHTFGEGFPLHLLEINEFSEGANYSSVRVQTNNELLWDIAVPIFEGASGTLRLGFSNQSALQALSELTTQLILVILMVLVASLIAAGLLTGVLTRPIQNLVDTTRAIAQADFSKRVERWADDEIGELADSFNQMAEELERLDEMRHERERLRRELLERVITTQEEERRRISRELHDSTSQRLTSMMVGLRSIEVDCDSPHISNQIVSLRQVLSETLDEVHSIAVQLRPTILDDLGLEAALERHIQQWKEGEDISPDLMVQIGPTRLPADVETALYRIVQEALRNISQHANASSVGILIERRDDEIVAIIEDNGRGFDDSIAVSSDRLGLLGMRERAELLGGHVSVESHVGGGTNMFVVIPLQPQAQSSV